MQMVIIRPVLVVFELNIQFKNETTKSIGEKKNHNNICRMQEYDIIICGFFCIRFIDFMLNNKRPIDFLIFFLQTT